MQSLRKQLEYNTFLCLGFSCYLRFFLINAVLITGIITFFKHVITGENFICYNDMNEFRLVKIILENLLHIKDMRLLIFPTTKQI